jgi:hypothetical protein
MDSRYEVSASERSAPEGAGPLLTRILPLSLPAKADPRAPVGVQR